VTTIGGSAPDVPPMGSCADAHMQELPVVSSSAIGRKPRSQRDDVMSMTSS
jgi:hypothetical protein